MRRKLCGKPPRPSYRGLISLACSACYGLASLAQPPQPGHDKTTQVDLQHDNTAGHALGHLAIFYA